MPARAASCLKKNPDEPMPPASITKIMTLLLVFEAMDEGKLAYTDMVTCSENANSMGGTQIWLEVGEQMSAEDLIKATAINSANDAAMALAEHVGGSEMAFVEMMNQKAKDLGMANTHFVNPPASMPTATYPLPGISPLCPEN